MTQFRLHPRVRFREVAGEGVLILQEKSEVVVMNETGAVVLRALQGGACDQEQIAAKLSAAFDVEVGDAAQDAAAFLSELVSLGAIQEVE